MKLFWYFSGASQHYLTCGNNIIHDFFNEYINLKYFPKSLSNNQIKK